MRIVEYDAARRGDLAGLMRRVWGAQDEDELAWFHERNPVRPSSVLLGEEDGTVVASVAVSFMRVVVGGETVLVGQAVRLATDPAYAGRGFFVELQRASEERARALGARFLVVVPNAASTPILRGRLGWSPLAPLRIWARPTPTPERGATVPRFSAAVGDAPTEGCVVRDAAWLDWRFADGPRRYTLVERDGGYAAVGRRGRISTVAAVGGGLVRPATAAAGPPVAIAAPRDADRGRFARLGWVPTPRTLTVLGTSLDPAFALPPKLQLELGDLDFL